MRSSHTPVPPEYHGREQALLKHRILERYLTRLILIVGQARADSIAYVDAFAGPWKSHASDLTDTSIGIALDQILAARHWFESQRRPVPRFTADFVESDSERFGLLQSYLSQRQLTLPADFQTTAWKGEFAELKHALLRSLDQGAFAFFFVDPMGWTDISPEALAPLLQRPNSELLINFHYPFINRFQDSLSHVVGLSLDELSGLPSEERERQVLLENRRRIVSQGLRVGIHLRTAYVRIMRPTQERTQYYLIYVTAHPKGIVTFMEESEEAEGHEQPIVRAATMERTSGQPSLFGPAAMASPFPRTPRVDLRREWRARLSSEPHRFTESDLADMLEATDCFISDIQSALRELIDEGAAVNLDSKRSRPKNTVNFRIGERLVATRPEGER